MTEAVLARLLEADQAIKPVDLGKALVAEATLMVIEPVDDDVLCAAVRVIRGVHRRRRADLVHQRHREQGGRRGPLGEIHAIEVAERGERAVTPTSMDR